MSHFYCRSFFVFLSDPHIDSLPLPCLLCASRDEGAKCTQSHTLTPTHRHTHPKGYQQHKKPIFNLQWSGKSPCPQPALSPTPIWRDRALTAAWVYVNVCASLHVFLCTVKRGWQKDMQIGLMVKQSVNKCRSHSTVSCSVSITEANTLLVSTSLEWCPSDPGSARSVWALTRLWFQGW